MININEIFGIPFFIMYLRKMVYILHYSISSQFGLAAFQMPVATIVWKPSFRDRTNVWKIEKRQTLFNKEEITS